GPGERGLGGSQEDPGAVRARTVRRARRQGQGSHQGDYRSGTSRTVAGPLAQGCELGGTSELVTPRAGEKEEDSLACRHGGSAVPGCWPPGRAGAQASARAHVEQVLR